MAPATLEQENHQRDADFNKVLHGKSAQSQGGFAAMRGKDAAAQKAAVDEYFKHWDNKAAEDETEKTRAVSSSEVYPFNWGDMLIVDCDAGPTSRVCDFDQTVRFTRLTYYHQLY